MKRDEIIEMAWQANLDREPPDEYCRVEYWTATFEDLVAYTKLVAEKAAAKEREACAKVADGYVGADPIAAAIRARGQA